MPSSRGLRPRHLTPFSLAGLRDLLPLGAVPDAADAPVTGVTHDSRLVRAGDLYVALPGEKTHGARFVESAVRSGAVAVLTDEAGFRLAGADSRTGEAVTDDNRAVPVITVDHPRAWLGSVSAAIYGQPSRKLLMLGVTGTNGKTTTEYLLESGLRAAGISTGLIGTVETRVGDEVVASVRTTPEATDVHALLAVMVERGVRACVMEVSSHALAFGRVNAVMFDVAGFTNLSQDHLDFHADLEEYFETKARLFTPGHARRGVVCADDEHGRRLAQISGIPTVTVTTGPEGGEAGGWAVRGTGAAHGAPGSLSLVAADGRRVPLAVPLPGAFNVANAALAVVMLAEAGVELGTAAAGVGACTGVPGRMERVSEVDDGPRAVVDYAHTPDAVQNVLRALRDDRIGGQGADARLIVVLGAGGDRDREKRPLMGAAAARYATIVVVTDDNPRSEEPAAIRAAVLAGAMSVREDDRAEVIEVAGRRAAIETALGLARDATDTVVVLGKGHEQGQEIAGHMEPFDDREVLREQLRYWKAKRQ